MDDTKTPKEGMEGNSSQKDEKTEAQNPFGTNVKPAMYIVWNEVSGSFGILGAPGFLDDPARAYYALKCAEKNLDDFYFQKNTWREKLTKGVQEFRNKIDFRKFINGKH